MTTALATLIEDIAAPKSDDFTVHEDKMDAHVRAAIARMVTWCQKQPTETAFLARGFVVDTLGDITQQITDYFPASIDVGPVIDDLSLVITQQAKNSSQRFQELELAYIGDGKIPEAAQANMQAFVKWYSAENVIGDDAQGNHNRLKPGWGGSAGGDGSSLLKLLNLATKKGFLLQVRALDITDAKSKTLLQNLDVVQAFGGSPEALKEAIEIIAKGGPDAATLKAVITQMVEIKQLRIALTNAGDTPSAGPIAAALAIKTEALSVQMATLKTPAVIKAAIGQAVETVKIDLQARQIESVISTLSQTISRPSAFHVAATQSPRVIMVAQLARHVEAIQLSARTQGVPVRDMVATTLAKSASPETVSKVSNITELMAKPEFFPVIEKAISPLPALSIRQALTTPVLQAAAQTPITPQAVTQTLQQLALKTDLPTIKMAAIAIETSAPTLRPQIMQTVVENLQATTLTRSVPEAVKPAIVVAAAQVEAAVIQSRQPEPNVQIHAVPQPVQPTAPIEAITVVTGVKTPEIIPAAEPRVLDVTPQAVEQRVERVIGQAPRNFDDRSKKIDERKPSDMRAPTPSVSPVSFNPANPRNPTSADPKKKEVTGKDCSTCDGKKGCCPAFNNAMMNEMSQQLKETVWTRLPEAVDHKAAIRPKVS